jgi:hypothetical protein
MTTSRDREPISNVSDRFARSSSRSCNGSPHEHRYIGRTRISVVSTAIDAGNIDIALNMLKFNSRPAQTISKPIDPALWKLVEAV